VLNGLGLSQLVAREAGAWKRMSTKRASNAMGGGREGGGGRTGREGQASLRAEILLSRIGAGKCLVKVGALTAEGRARVGELALGKVAHGSRTLEFT